MQYFSTLYFVISFLSALADSVTFRVAANEIKDRSTREALNIQLQNIDQEKFGRNDLEGRRVKSGNSWSGGSWGDWEWELPEWLGKLSVSGGWAGGGWVSGKWRRGGGRYGAVDWANGILGRPYIWSGVDYYNKRIGNRDLYYYVDYE